jgi:hypothetical protein
MKLTNFQPRASRRNHERQQKLRIAFVAFLFLLASLTAVSCAPVDDPRSAAADAGQDDSANVEPLPPPVALPQARKDRIDMVLEHIRKRDLRTDHAFWTIFHGILGMGPDHAMLIDPATNKRVKALDYLASGNDVRGLDFIPTPDGIEVRTMPGSITGQGHQDQFVAEIGEWGIPRTMKFVVNGKDYTFDDFIREARAHASVTRNDELSWTIVIVSQFYGPDHHWTNNRSESLTVEDMARYELNQPIATSPVCGGTHRLFGLTWAYHLHRKAGGKKTGVWKDVADTIADYEGQARRFQNPDGSFSTNYLDGPGNDPDPQLRLATTGHILEWLALAMTDAELRQSWVEKAADALTLMILNNIDQPLDGGALYHAAHGLELYRARLWPSGQPLPFPLPPKD